jgi:radical SAM protein with 4Fe4S-binding SPASM domain
MYISIRDFLVRNLKKYPRIWYFFEVMQGLTFRIGYLYYYKTAAGSERSSIREINLQFSNTCNLNCEFCTLKSGGHSRFMTGETLARFLENLNSDPRFQTVDVINLYNGGETLLHPGVAKMLAVLRKYKDQARADGKKFPETVLLTNGMLLTENLTREILGSGAVDSMRFSLDGGTPEAFEQMRKPAKWPVFYKNVKYFIEQNRLGGGKIKTGAITLLPEKPLETSWMHPEFAEILNSLDSCDLRRPHTWGGALKKVESRGRPHKIGCNMLLSQLVLFPGGDVSVCCVDINGECIIGNIHRQDLFSIYRSATRLKMLEALDKGKKDTIDFCRNCDTH